MKFETIKYERLVENILAGEVVFFVGAGFSLDSEGNSAQRLIARLLARFAALVEHVAPTNEALAGLPLGLKRTFNLQIDEDIVTARDIVTEKVVGRLSERYYDINDWIISAFDALLTALGGGPGPEIARSINVRENELLRQCPLKSKHDPVALTAIPFAILYAVPSDTRGKALFLETMGFFDESMMAGDPAHAELQRVMSDYDGIVRDRHRVLARLAREGLCPLLITTNYDLLLEGAFRLSGFDVPPFGEMTTASRDSSRPPATFDRLHRIGAPADFFKRGSGFRSALLVKIHGCTNRYRLERGNDQWWNYLASIVFTYREIQNWRKDSWSRDLVTTLLRTRTMILCGYSGADPVVHDTFRTVYEEIRNQRGPAVNDTAAPQNVRAYFTGGAASREFHGLEILRAASRAAGSDSPSLTDHDNYLPFYFLNEKKFPTLDEIMVWIFHRTVRGLQKQALRTDLRRTASQLLQRPTPESELEAVRKNFDAMESAEQARARNWTEERSSHWEFGRVAGWTDRFHTSLLREFALAETVQRNQGPGLRLEHLRSARSYYPVSDQPGWAAWGVVVEIALRRMIQAYRTTGARRWTDDHGYVEPAICEYPAILISQSDEHPSPTCVLLRFAGFERAGYRPEIRGAYKRLTIWDLTAGVEPRLRRTTRSSARRPRVLESTKVARAASHRSPGAHDLWRWATAPPDHSWGEQDRRNARRWLKDA